MGQKLLMTLVFTGPPPVPSSHILSKHPDPIFQSPCTFLEDGIETDYEDILALHRALFSFLNDEELKQRQEIK